jgi:hypothetical protein
MLFPTKLHCFLNGGNSFSSANGDVRIDWKELREWTQLELHSSNCTWLPPSYHSDLSLMSPLQSRFPWITFPWSHIHIHTLSLSLSLILVMLGIETRQELYHWAILLAPCIISLPHLNFIIALQLSKTCLYICLCVLLSVSPYQHVSYRGTVSAFYIALA